MMIRWIRILTANKGRITFEGRSPSKETRMAKDNIAIRINSKVLLPFMLMASKVAGIIRQV